jgi:hypothetical protein
MGRPATARSLRVCSGREPLSRLCGLVVALWVKPSTVVPGRYAALHCVHWADRNRQSGLGFK